MRPSAHAGITTCQAHCHAARLRTAVRDADQRFTGHINPIAAARELENQANAPCMQRESEGKSTRVKKETMLFSKLLAARLRTLNRRRSLYSPQTQNGRHRQGYCTRWNLQSAIAGSPTSRAWRSCTPPITWNHTRVAEVLRPDYSSETFYAGKIAVSYH